MDFGQITGPLSVIRAIAGFILVFFLPGFAWTFVFFKKVNIIERIALGIALSVALVTLATIVLNIVFHLKINGLNALVTVIILTLIPAGIYLYKRLVRRKSETSDGE